MGRWYLIFGMGRTRWARALWSLGTMGGRVSGVCVGQSSPDHLTSTPTPSHSSAMAVWDTANDQIAVKWQY